jgi:NAD-dependent deacetylase
MDEVDELRRMIGEAPSIVAFTGAGISTESGIPDFRSPGGIWTKYQPIEFSDFLANEESRRESWRRKFVTDETMRNATPNAGHRALAKLHEQGKLLGVVTQNIDGLHEASGIPRDCIAELHGNSTYAACLDCGHRHELDWVREVFAVDETLPLCLACGGIIKTATISFGQAMPQDAMAHAHEMTCAADLFIVLGSSLVVYPAAGFPVLAKRNGSKVVIVNRDPTDLDALADLIINAEIGATMSKAVGVN